MPLTAACGTSEARISPDSVKNSMPPERSWLSMSVSDPSWLAGNTWISSLPLLSAFTRSAISRLRTFSGCAGGRLLAYL